MVSTDFRSGALILAPTRVGTRGGWGSHICRFCRNGDLEQLRASITRSKNHTQETRNTESTDKAPRLTLDSTDQRLTRNLGLTPQSPICWFYTSGGCLGRGHGDPKRGRSPPLDSLGGGGRACSLGSAKGWHRIRVPRLMHRELEPRLRATGRLPPTPAGSPGPRRRSSTHYRHQPRMRPRHCPE